MVRNIVLTASSLVFALSACGGSGGSETATVYEVSEPAAEAAVEVDFSRRTQFDPHPGTGTRDDKVDIQCDGDHCTAEVSTGSGAFVYVLASYEVCHGSGSWWRASKGSRPPLSGWRDLHLLHLFQKLASLMSFATAEGHPYAAVTALA